MRIPGRPYQGGIRISIPLRWIRPLLYSCYTTSFLVTASETPPTYNTHRAGLAQLVEQLICNQLVEGSIPLPGTTYPSSNIQYLPASGCI